MTDYAELIRSLKACEHDECCPERCDWFGKYQVDLRCKNILLANAAAAIEALQAELEKKRTADCWGCKCEKLEPKRSQWTNLRISVDGTSSVECVLCGATIHNGFTKEPNYCPNCGAKMEVQDGSC